MAEYWFARSLINGKPGRQVTPLSWQGWAVIFGFVGAMIAGGLAFLLVGLLTGQVLLGAAIFVCCAIAGAGTFIWAAATKSNPQPRIMETSR